LIYIAVSLWYPSDWKCEALAALFEMHRVVASSFTVWHVNIPFTQPKVEWTFDLDFA